MQLFVWQKQRSALAGVSHRERRGFCGTCVSHVVRLASFVLPIVVFSLTLTTFCAPSRDSVLSDVERNYASTGFLDPNTFQIRCVLGEGESRLAECREKLVVALLDYKERYDREAFARRMHQDFLPFVKPAEARDADRELWRGFFTGLIESKTRIVFEVRTGDKYEGVYRLRLPDLIYRVQRAA